MSHPSTERSFSSLLVNVVLSKVFFVVVCLFARVVLYCVQPCHTQFCCLVRFYPVHV